MNYNIRLLYSSYNINYYYYYILFIGHILPKIWMGILVQIYWTKLLTWTELKLLEELIFFHRVKII